MNTHPILVAGTWNPSGTEDTFQAQSPRTGQALPDRYPISSWSDCDQALDAASTAFEELIQCPASAIADFLEAYATAIQGARRNTQRLAPGVGSGGIGRQKISEG